MGFLKIINENPVFIFVTSMFTIIAFPLSIYLFFQSLGVKKFKYISKWYIFDKDNEQLPIGLYIPKYLLDKAPSYYAIPCNPPIRTHHGFLYGFPRPEAEPISMYDRNDNICIAKFAFWNSGKYCLNANDVVPEKPIQIYNSINKIISVSVIEQEERTNHIKAYLIDEHTVNISFDYIDKHEGAVIAIAYTGITSSSINNFHFTGKIKGGWKIKEIFNNEYRLKRVSRNFFHEIKMPKIYNWILILCIAPIALFLFLCLVLSFLPLFINGADKSSIIILMMTIVPWFAGCLLTLLSSIDNAFIPHKIWNAFNTGRSLL